MDQEKSEKRIAKRCVTGCVLIVLSLLICGPAFAAKFDKYPGKVRIETDAPGVEITISDIFGHPVEIAVVRLQAPKPTDRSIWLPFGFPVPGALRHLVKEDRYEIVKIGTVKDGRFTYPVKYTGSFKVQVRDLTQVGISGAEASPPPCTLRGCPW